MKTNRDVIEAGLRAIGREEIISLLPEPGDISIQGLDDPNEGQAPMGCLRSSYLGFVWAETDQGQEFWGNIMGDLWGTDFRNISVSDLQSNNADINAAMKSRDEAPESHPSDPYPEYKAPPEPQHWTARMAPMEAKFAPAFFGFLRR